MKIKNKVALAIICFMPLIKLAFPAHAYNHQKAKSVDCILYTNSGPVTVAIGSICDEGGTVCAANDCPGNSKPPEF